MKFKEKTNSLENKDGKSGLLEKLKTKFGKDLLTDLLNKLP